MGNYPTFPVQVTQIHVYNSHTVPQGSIIYSTCMAIFIHYDTCRSSSVPVDTCHYHFKGSMRLLWQLTDDLACDVTTKNYTLQSSGNRHSLQNSYSLQHSVLLSREPLATYFAHLHATGHSQCGNMCLCTFVSRCNKSTSPCSQPTLSQLTMLLVPIG